MSDRSDVSSTKLRTICFVDLLEGDWLASLERLPSQPAFREACPERSWHMRQASPLQHEADKISQERDAKGADQKSRTAGICHFGETQLMSVSR